MLLLRNVRRFFYIVWSVSTMIFFWRGRGEIDALSIALPYMVMLLAIGPSLTESALLLSLGWRGWCRPRFIYNAQTAFLVRHSSVLWYFVNVCAAAIFKAVLHKYLNTFILKAKESKLLHQLYLNFILRVLRWIIWTKLMIGRDRYFRIGANFREVFE